MADPRNREVLFRRSARAETILRALSRDPHITDYYASAARCRLGEATVELMRLEREGLVQRGNSGFGMTWRATA